MNKTLSKAMVIAACLPCVMGSSIIFADTETGTPTNQINQYIEIPGVVGSKLTQKNSTLLTVAFQDEKGNRIARDIIYRARKGSKVSITGQWIAGYTVQSIVAPNSFESSGDNPVGDPTLPWHISFPTAPATLTYIYKRDVVPGGNITVNYVDELGKTLAPAKTLTGNVGDAYSTESETINGYTLTKVPENADGTFSVDDQTVTYVYEKSDAAPITVYYKDENGKDIANSETKTGKIGDTYTTEPATIAGYTLKTTPINASGTFSDQGQTITYIYTKNPETVGNVTVKYVDADGNELSPKVTLSGKMGENYTSQAKQINDYTLVGTPANATGTFTKQPQVVTYVYTKNKVNFYDVVISYLDESGNKLSEDEVLQGQAGETYSTSARTIAGYTFKNVSMGNASGEFKNHEQKVVYVYSRNKQIKTNTPTDTNAKKSADVSTYVKDTVDTSEQNNLMGNVHSVVAQPTLAQRETTQIPKDSGAVLPYTHADQKRHMPLTLLALALSASLVVFFIQKKQ